MFDARAESNRNQKFLVPVFESSRVRPLHFPTAGQTQDLGTRLEFNQIKKFLRCRKQCVPFVPCKGICMSVLEFQLAFNFSATSRLSVKNSAHFSAINSQLSELSYDALKIASFFRES